jgi:hypothetical protein
MRNEKKNRLLIESVRYITGNQKSLKVQGPTNFVKAYQTAVKASRALYEGIYKKDASVKEIEKLVEAKNLAAKQFRKITGSVWPF